MKILLATDGSSFSAVATQALIANVKRGGTEVRAIHVVDTRKERRHDMTALDAEVINAPAQRRSAEALVETIAKLLRAEGLTASTALVWGDPRLKIIEVAREWPANLIVLGSHGRTGLRRLLMGSVADAVAHYAPCSVEIVRAPKGQAAPRASRILLPMDDSEFSLAAADALIAQFKPEGLEVNLLRVLEPFPVAEVEEFGGQDYPDFAAAGSELRAQAFRQLSKTAERLQTLGFKTAQNIVEEGDVRDIILDSADRWRADLIIIGSHGSRGAAPLLMGSVSEAVSRYAVCSVEIVRRARDH